MDIVQAGTQHIEALVQMRLDFYEDLGYDIDPAIGLAASLRGYYRDALADGSFAAWFVQVDGAPVSTVYAVFHRTLPGRRMPGGRQCTVLNVFTYPEHRGKGYARALMTRVVEHARDNGVELLDLFATPAGEKVYRPLGFARQMEDPYLSMDPREWEGGHA